MKKIFLLLLITVISSFQIFSEVVIDGINTQTSRTLKKGEVVISGSALFEKDITFFNDEKIDIKSIPLNVRFGLSKSREIGFFIKIDSLNGEKSTNDLTRLDVSGKWDLLKKLSFKINLGYSSDNQNYYSTDGIYVKTSLFYDLNIIDNYTVFFNAGYEYVDGKYDYNNIKYTMKKRFDFGMGIYFPVKKNLCFLLEGLGQTKYADDLENLLSVSLGIKYLLDKNLELVGNVGAGLSDGSPDVKFNVGFLKSFGILYNSKFSKYAIDDNEKNDVTITEVEYEKFTNEVENKLYYKKVCPVCGYKTDNDEENFCPYDGSKLINVKKDVINYCPVCHNKLPENSIFCPYCGAQVKKSVYTSSRTNKKNFESPETENITKPKFLKSKKLSNLQQVKLDSYLENAKVAFDDGEYAVAIDYYIKATKIDKKNYKLFYNLGVAHYFAKNYFDSKLSFEKSLEKKENDVDTLLYLGSVNGRLGLLNDSESCFKKVLEIDPKNKIAMKNLHKLQSIRK